MSKWQPISTAPKDGTRILVCLSGAFRYHPTTACWANYHPNAKGKETWRTSNVAGDKLTPTHWQPLPEPPKEDA